jgi:hypothetical protein
MYTEQSIAISYGCQECSQILREELMASKNRVLRRYLDPRKMK